MKLTEDGRNLVEDTQAALAIAKASMRDVARNMRQLSKLDREAGELKASNASMRLEGEAHRALGIIIAAHADASDALLDYHAEDGQVVIMGGGGGRG